jgi:hypothetical protein
VPVGTEYHWYILAHQNVHKLNANDYTTSMTGVKFKIAHKRAESDKWSATPKTQRKRMIKFLRDVIADLEHQQDEETAAPAAARGRKRSKAPAAKTAKPRKSTKKKEPGGVSERMAA